MSAVDGLMHVALDARTLNQVHLRGMGRCVSELVGRGAARHGVHWELLADRPDLPFHAPEAAGLRQHVFETRGYRFRSWEQLSWPRQAKKLKADVMHGPGTTIPWWQPVPTVVTLHDTIPWRGNEPGWPRGWYVDRVLPRAYEKCSAIITGSECARRDISDLWPKLANKITVIPHGVNDVYLEVKPQPLSDTLRGFGVREPYFLYFGGYIPRKRLDWALQVLTQIRDTDAMLVVCGLESSAHAEFRDRLPAALRNRACFTSFVSESDMPRLYQNAVAVLYPSLYEGFGLPVVEAQAVGTPVLFSALGSMAELIGPGSHVLPPDAMDAWTTTCRSLLEGRRGLLPNLEARAWAKRFSWDATADATIEVYQQAIRTHRTSKR